MNSLSLAGEIENKVANSFSFMHVNFAGEIFAQNSVFI